MNYSVTTSGFFFVVSIAYTVFAASISAASTPANHRVIQAEKGIVDLRQFGSDPFALKLRGEWMVFPERLDLPSVSESNQAQTFFPIPGYFSSMSTDSVKRSPFSHALFSLKILLPAGSAGKRFSIIAPEQISAFSLYLDTLCIGSSGTVGTSHTTHHSGASTFMQTFIAASDTITLHLAVSDYSLGDGGPYRAPWIGTPDAVNRKFAYMLGLDLLLIGALILAGLYHLGLFVHRRKDSAYFYFGLLTLLWSVRFLFDGMFFRYMGIVAPIFPYDFFTRYQHLASIPTSWMLLAFAYRLYPHEKIKYSEGYAVLGTILLMIFTLFTPPQYLAEMLLAYQLFSFTLTYFLYATLIRAVYNKKQGSLLLILGTLCFIISATHDTLFSLGIIDSVNLISVGIFLQTIFFSVILSKRYALVFNAAEELALELESKNKALTRLDNLKDDFLANTSHELRTPLLGIIGLAETLLHSVKKEHNAQAVNQLTLIAASGRRLSHLVNDIQDFSRLKHGELPLYRKPISLFRITDSIITLARYSQKNNAVVIENRIDANLPPLFADEQRLEQVIYNLLGNALKFTEKGSVVLSSQIQSSYMEIKIADSGCGIEENALGTIFEAYDSSNALAGKKGTGLGLPISRKLVELHGGMLSVTSTVGVGTVFTFTIPLADSGSSVIDTAPISPASTIPDIDFSSATISESNHPRNQSRILVVDDEPVNRTVIVAFLEPVYENISAVDSGEAACEEIDKGGVDLVILDIMMPGMGGYATLERIRGRLSAAELPVIFLTAKNRVSDLKAGFAAGANDYLTKPCSREELLSRVAAQLKIHEAALLMLEVKRLKRIVEQQRALELLPEGDALPRQDNKELAVKAMKLSLRSYTHETDRGVVAFARESGLWKIEINADGWERARTLDRYLSINDCPKNPRMKTVFASVAFALETASLSNPFKKELVSVFEELETTI